MLEIKDLVYGYGEKNVLNHVHLKAESGKIMSIIGPNGSGKTTLLKCLAGLNRFKTGELWVNGQCVPRPVHKTMSGLSGFLPQQIPSSGGFTAFETVLLGRASQMTWRAGRSDIKATEKIMAELGVMEFAQRTLGELSGGERQRVFIAQALVRNPRVLFFDEPTSSLDLRHQFDVLNQISRITREKKIITIMVMHDLNLAIQYARTIAVLVKGRVIRHGSPFDVLNAETIKEVYGVRAWVDTNPDAPWIKFSGMADNKL